MSDETGRVGESALSPAAVLDSLEDWYHIPVLGALLAFMLWVRVQSYERFIRNGEVLFSGNDPWYHYRQVVYTANNWPSVMPFDPWTYFSYGTSVGQFGTLFDQLIATVALVIGLGNPSDQTVALTVLFAPAVFGMLVAVPTYFIAKRLAGGRRFAGVFAVLVLALLPGLFLRRGLVGTADHNIAEPLFQSLAVLATMVALGVAERYHPVWEQVVDRDVAGLRAPLGWSVIAGVALGLYIWVWPPGLFLFGILGAFYVVKLSADYVRGRSPEHVAFVAATSMIVAGLLCLVPLSTTEFSATQFSLLQPLLAFVVGVGALFMAWLAREWEARDYAPSLYPLLVFGLAAAGVLFVAVALPDLFGMIRSNVTRVIGFDTNAGTRTIAEAQPFLSRAEFFPAVFGQYGLTFFTAIAGALVAISRAARTRANGELLLVVVWTVFIISAAFTQVRFNYYLAVPVAVLTGYFVTWVFGLFGAVDSASEIDVSHVFIAATIALLVVAPLAAGVNTDNGRVFSPVEVGKSANPAGSGVTGWDGTLSWMRNNTPEEGTYGGADNGDALDYYGTYPQQADFDYPAGAYGVLSWWDYGHWITTLGHRVPNANPFQQAAIPAARYLLAPDESAANATLEAMDENDARTEYVMVDWQMVRPSAQTYERTVLGLQSLPAGKFDAPVVFFNKEPSAYYDSGRLPERQLYDVVYDVNQQQGQVIPRLAVKQQRYYESQMVRLYRFHGSAMTPSPIVVDWDTYRGAYKQTPTGQNASVIRQFDTMEEARAFVENDTTSQLGGVGATPPEFVPALEHYRMVRASTESAPGLLQLTGRFQNVPSHVKLFERVPGATVQGEGPANATVWANVTLEVPNRNPRGDPNGTTTFTYRQRAQTGPDGTFNMTLPYSTTGYEEWGSQEGYTNVSVRAAGPYEFSTPVVQENRTFASYNATVHVPEGNVVGANESAVQVTLQRHERETEGQREHERRSNESNASNASANGSHVAAPPAPALAAGDSVGGSESSSARRDPSPGAPTAAVARHG